ncbi:GNAT family N-acetyltransferase [Altererythrobacter sp. Root672]|uniref:GNAT family N-acetyltransferase n=1 Tax=Altererythrobacter sp. Root672 TaxID=1736584 RepID=UPI0006F73609|nr:GNAT family N-acetyltransferase [Altererythrobacter sp. Root672]KRA84632.1 hypothetical protein ASD76_05540 [Altererythrobacter sp. Root672]
MTAVSYHDTVNDLQGLGLTSRNPFTRPEWFALLESAGAKPVIALARDGRGVVALPLARNSHGLESFSNWYAFTWSDLATDEGSREPLLERAASELSRKATCVTLSKLPDEDGTATRLESAFRNAGWFVHRERCDWNHFLRVDGRAFAEFLAGRPGALRTTLKRKAKKVEIELLTDFHDDAWASYEAIYAQSWKPEEGDRALLRNFAKAEGEAGRLRLGLASHEGEVVAAQMWTVDHGTAYIHKLAHLESAKPLSAGTTLTAALFEQVIDRDHVECVDFGTGNDPYKRDWMEEVRPRYRLTCWRAGNPRNWPAIGKSLLRQLVSQPSPL